MPNIPSSNPDHRTLKRATVAAGVVVVVGAGLWHYLSSRPELDFSAPSFASSSGGLSNPEDDEMRSEFFRRLAAIAATLGYLDEKTVQHETAKWMAECIATRSSVPTSCQALPRVASDTLNYQPSEVGCIAEDEYGGPQTVSLTYVGPICNEFEQFDAGPCIDQSQASIMIHGEAAARLILAAQEEAVHGKPDDHPPFTIFDNYIWEANRIAEGTSTWDLFEDDIDIDAMAQEADFLCDEAVAMLENPSPKDMVAAYQYQVYLDAQDALWGALQPFHMAPPNPTLPFSSYRDEGTFNIPVQLDGDPDSTVFVELTIPEMGFDEPPSLFLDPRYSSSGSPYPVQDEGCYMGTPIEDMFTEEGAAAFSSCLNQ